MDTAEYINPVIERLGRVLDDGNLPPPYDRWGARLLAHLTKPVQIVVTGLEETGKSALIEMMVGRSVIGRELNIPLIEIAYGEIEQALIERPDGSVTVAAGCLKDHVCPEDAIRVRQELPDPRLMQQSYIEVSLHGTMPEKHAALNSAIERTDLMVWCSQKFTEEEQALWATVPDHIKDHSVFALTMADHQLMRGVLTENIARLEPIVAEEFLGLFPVATLQGVAAQTCADAINEDLWSSSGGKHLMELINRQVRQGRKADIDQARIFMDRLAARMPQISTNTTDEPAIEICDAHCPGVVPAHTDGNVVETGTVESREAVAVLSEAVDLLQQHAVRMLEEMNNAEDVNADQILNGCSQAISSLSGLLETTGTGDPAAQAIQDDVQEGEEMLMLFQLERGEEAALDAVTLMLQIRKEMVDKLAV